MWLIAIGLLTFAAVSDVSRVRIDRQDKNLYLTDGLGNVITDGLGNGITTTGREHRLELVIGAERVLLWRWFQP